jgi:NAD(P)-dependent dehydrogenase (short-subunit alcohol dehydrogenase family)
MSSAALSGRTAVVTGAGRGIGAAIAKALAQHGASVVLIGRNAAPLEAQAGSLGTATLVATADVSDAASVQAAFVKIRERFPRIDILANNAGQAESAPFGKTALALWEKMLAINLTGTFLCSREVYPAMAKQDYGRIVNVASTAGLIGYPYVAAYCAAKHGVIGLTRALAREAAKTHVTVNAVCPGYTETELVKDAVANIIAKTGKSEAEARAALVANNPQGRMVQPAEVANAVLWLCLPGSEAVTGQSVTVAGGEVT